MSKKHARLSPSSADRWTSCTASANAQDGIPNKNSDASRQGTTCHQIQEELLLNPELVPHSYVGRTLVFWYHPESDSRGESWAEEYAEMAETADGGLCAIEAEVSVTEAMVDAVIAAVEFIREQHALLGGEMLVEQRVPVGQFTGEDDAHGSADVILLGATWIAVFDSKFGRKRVNAAKVLRPPRVDFITGEVLPELRGPNLQMASYALGAVHEHDIFGAIETVTMVIVQPFIGHTDSYSCAIEELRETEKFLVIKAEETRTAPKFVPNFENCFFCRAKGRCDAQSNRALTTVFDGFGDADEGIVNPPNPLTLGSQYAMVPFVEKWVADVTEAVREALYEGEPVVRNDGVAYKLVAGKAGNREWSDENQAAEILRQARLTREEMYVFKLISPAMAEKMAKPKRPPKGEQPKPAPLPPSKWRVLQDLITRSEGQSAIALETDPRPALCKAEGFEDVTPPEETTATLFGA